MTITIPGLSLILTAAVLILGWVISVERRITTLQGIAGDIHEMKNMMKLFVGDPPS